MYGTCKKDPDLENYPNGGCRRLGEAVRAVPDWVPEESMNQPERASYVTILEVKVHAGT